MKVAAPPLEKLKVFITNDYQLLGLWDFVASSMLVKPNYMAWRLWKTCTDT
jgi:hypothetical protein